MKTFGTAMILMATTLRVAAMAEEPSGGLLVGWAVEDITPDRPAVLGGMPWARISDGVLDPLTATALALETDYPGRRPEGVILISCDLLRIRDELRDGVRRYLAENLPELSSLRVVLNATHSHSAPPLGEFGVELQGMSEAEYVEFAVPRIAAAAERAWKNREPGGISYGLAYAVVGRNRLISYESSRSLMYGNTDRHDFSHVEGYEDPSVNLLYTWQPGGQLTGIIINLAAPSQVSRASAKLSADFWRDTREILEQRLGVGLHILSQCSAAGDQDTDVLWDKRADARMLRLSGRDRRREIAVRIADAVTSILPLMEKNIEWQPLLTHHASVLQLPRRMLSEQDVAQALDQARPHRDKYERMRAELEGNPDLKADSGWLREMTQAYWHARRGNRVAERYELQQSDPFYPVEAHVIRLGEIVFATNPFELYLDYGIRIKSRASPAVQTFIVQLAGSGTYVPTQRSVAGGAYGSEPASTQIGTEGGRALVEWTVEAIRELWGRNLQIAVNGGLELPAEAWMGTQIFDAYRGNPPMAVVRRKSSPMPRVHAYFEIDAAPDGTAELQLQGMDNEKSEKAEIDVRINGHPIYRGPVDFPKDNRSLAAATWAWRSHAIPAGVLIAGENRIVIENILGDDPHDESRSADYNWGWCMIGRARIIHE